MSPLMHVTVVGTGVSSLLLAQALLRREACDRLTLVGPRRPLKPHLISYWADHPTPFDGHQVAAWDTVEVVARGQTLRLPLKRFRYRSVRAREWAADALATVLASGRAELVEAAVDVIDDDLLRPTVLCNGRRLSSDWVFTSTPQARAAPDAWQRFEGWELEVPGGTLDTRAATLLDFRTEAPDDLRFVYALPLAPNRLFVEHVSYQSCDHEAALAAYLHDVAGVHDWHIVDREGGATPIYREPLPRPEARVVHIGVAAGLAKASTGYAVMRMWRDAEAIASALAAHHDPASALRWPSLYRVADHFFLDLLRSEPARIESLLGELFGGADGDAVLAFLDEQATASQQARVALAMPDWLSWALVGRDEPVTAAP